LTFGSGSEAVLEILAPQAMAVHAQQQAALGRRDECDLLAGVA
jgi:hypothetical protein